MGISDEQNKFRFISKCFDVCVQSFADKHFNPYERECMMQCLQTVVTSHIEMASSLELVKDADYEKVDVFKQKTAAQ